MSGCCGSAKRLTMAERLAQEAAARRTAGSGMENQLSQMEAAKAATSKPRSGTGGKQAFALELPGQRTQTFGSKLEADAENVRQGYRGRVRPV